MRIFVHDTAKEKVRKISRYIQASFGKNARLKFRHEIAHVSQLLLQNPNLGPAEPYLADAPVLYRSIVVNRLNKIIYWINDDVIEIVDFWDTRREPTAQAVQLTPAPSDQRKQ